MTTKWGTREAAPATQLPPDNFAPAPAEARPEPLRPPTELLAGAAATAVVAWLLAALSGQAFHLAGWALGSLGTIGFVTAYSAVDGRRAQSTLYAAFPGAARARTAVVMVGFAAGVYHAILFARAVAS